MSVDTSEIWLRFQDRAEAFPDRTALFLAGEDVSYRELMGRSEGLAALMKGLGVSRGSLVALSFSNGADFVAALLAAFRCSAVVGLVSPKYRASELVAIHQGVAPDFWLTSGPAGEELGSRLESVLAGIESTDLGDTPVRVMMAAETIGSAKKSAPTRSGLLRSPDVALLKFTSGSTGVPKGVALSVRNLLAEAANVVATLKLTSGDKILTPVPLVHSYGFDLAVLPMILYGVPVVVREAFVPRMVLNDLSERETTIFLGVPSIYRTLVDIPISTIPDLRHVRYLLSCTAPLPPDVISAFADKFQMPICQHYGSSETGAATTHSPTHVARVPTSVGLPMDNVEISVVDDGGAVVSAGESGEVVIASEAVALGYVMGEPTGQSPFRGNTYWTGDLGFCDNEGFLHLTGRKGDLISVGGLKVSPNEVARVLEQFPAIREAAVLGIPGQHGEDVVCAVVTLRQPCSEKAIIAFCRDNLADYKVPRRLQIRDELPRGPTGKVKLTAAEL